MIETGIAGIALAHGLVQGAGIADLGLVLIQKGMKVNVLE